jgi:hypothetical protein
VSQRRRLDPLACHRVPSPPPELATRVLVAARINAEEPRAGWVDHLWESRTARLLWGAVLGLLLAGNVLAGRLHPEPAVPLATRESARSIAAVLDLLGADSSAPIAWLGAPDFGDGGGASLGRGQQLESVLEETAR